MSSHSRQSCQIGKTKCIVHSAAQAGAGIISALDIRNTTAKAKGTGGLLQVSSYLTGNSGGSWLVSSMLFQSYPDMFDLVLGNTDKGGEINGWLLEKDVTLPGGPNPNDPKNQQYLGCVIGVIIPHIGYIHLSYRNLFKSVVAKARAGFDTSVTDLWSLGLAYHFLSGLGASNMVDSITTTDNFFTNETSHGAGILWSDMTDLPVFQSHQFPIPIVVVDSLPVAKLPPNTAVFLNSTSYEFTPWELGSYDPNLSAFVDVRFMGTSLLDGKPANSSSCVTAFDQTSFIFGTSSSLFNVRICA